MTFTQVKDVLVKVRGFHERWNAAMNACEVAEQDEKSILLVDVTRHHLAEFERDTTADPGSKDGADAPRPVVLETWMQFVPDDDVESAIRELEQHDSIDAGTLVRLSHDFLLGLRHLYGTLAEASAADGVREFFERLRERTAWEVDRLGWSTRPSPE